MKRKKKKQTLGGTLGQNWPLVLALSLAIIGAGAGVFGGFSGGGLSAVAAQVPCLNPTTVMSEDQMREVLFAPPAPPPSTIQEEKQKAVVGYRARYDANPADADAEALLRAMANLYKQTGELKNAAWAYGQFLRRFPESTVRSGVYLELAACYEQIGESDNLTRLYLDMMKVFAANSNEYKFAEASLKLSDLKFKQRNPDAAPPPGPEGTFTIETLSDGTVRYVDMVRKPNSGAPAPAQRIVL